MCRLGICKEQRKKLGKIEGKEKESRFISLLSLKGFCYLLCCHPPFNTREMKYGLVAFDKTAQLSNIKFEVKKFYI